MSGPSRGRYGRRFWLGGVAMAMSAVCVSAAHADCETTWSAAFQMPGDSAATIYDSTIWDDGSGPALYVVGQFRSIGNALSNPTLSGSIATWYGPYNVAKWNGSRWERVGPPVQTADVIFNFLRLNCITSFDPDGPDGPASSVLVVGGASSTGGSGIAAWNGAAWSKLGNGLVSNSGLPEVTALAVYDEDGSGPNPPRLFAGGNFRPTTTSGQFAIGRWDGASWQNVAGSMGASSARVASMAVYNDELYVGGNFTAAGQSPTVTTPGGLAKWNGTSWSAVSGVLASAAATFVSTTPITVETVDEGDGPALLVSGMRYTGLSANVGLAQLKDGVWSTLLGRGMVYSATMYSGSLYIGGNALGPSSAWSTDPVSIGVDQGATKLFRKRVAGSSTSWENIGYIGRYGYASDGSDLVDGAGIVRTLMPIDWDASGPGGQKLFAAGPFAYVDDHVHYKMFLWNGTGAEAITTNGGGQALGFNGSPTGSGGANAGEVNIVKEVDIDGSGPAQPTLLIAGEIYSAGTKRLLGIVGFDGSEYAQIGQEYVPTQFQGVTDVLYFNDGSNARLFIARSTIASLDPVTGAWQFVGTGEENASHLLQFPINGQDRVVALGSSGINWLDGSTWQPLNNGLPVSFSQFYDTVVWNDGSGPTMYICLRTSEDGGATNINRLFRWNTTTSQWEAWGDLTSTASSVSIDLAVHNGDLYIAGTFSGINDVPGTASVARRSGSTWVPVVDAFMPDSGGILRADKVTWHNFGSGPELVIRGNFEDSTGFLSSAARWNGTSWTLIPGLSPIATGDGDVFSIASGKPYDGLYFTGGTNLYRQDPALTVRNDGLARLQTVCTAPGSCCRGTTCMAIGGGSCVGVVAGSNSLVVTSCGAGDALATCCYADFNHDGTPSIDDLFLYLNAYFTGSPWANVGGDGVAAPTIDDLFLYINAYFNGCV